jgi:hypothetical protein
LEEAIARMRASGHRIKSTGGIDAETVAACEAWLGVGLPISYRQFLGLLGALSFRSLEIYGFTRGGFAAPSVPSFLFVTKSARDRGEIGARDVAVMSSGFGPCFVLSTADMGPDHECPVRLAVSDPAGEYTEGHESFGAFFLHEVKAVLAQADG